MTEPTQQALRDALQLFIQTVNPPYPQSMALWQEHLKAATAKAKAALTAAAQVELAENLVASATDEDSKVQHFPMGRPAAAEVGKKHTLDNGEPLNLAAAEVGESRDYMQGYVDGGKETRATTIERCAAVADMSRGLSAESIAAAIRALATEGK